ncbi:MAG: prefoldin subunit beta [Candidatus Aenigmatarchaeota archaeon]
MEKDQTSQILGQAQLYSQQIQTVAAQKAALTMELNEIKRALEEVKKAKEKFVYKLSGPILIKVDAQELVKDFEEKETMVNLRLKTLEKQELRLKEKIEELRTRMIKVTPSKDEEENGR